MVSQQPKADAYVIGGGLAGCEASWQLANHGLKVCLFEMRPQASNPAHKTATLAELVCSNSLKSVDEYSAPGLLKQEMSQLNSLIIKTAYKHRIPCGQALGVNRDQFAQTIETTLKQHPNIKIIREPVHDILDFIATAEQDNKLFTVIIATGPLSEEKFVHSVQTLTGQHENLYFYDAIAPILAADSIDLQQAFFANRYDNDSQDYLNIPLTQQQYATFIQDVREAEKMPLHHFESTPYFESCLPIEVMVERGEQTLRFGPMKPVGLIDPRTGKKPYAVIQLRRENEEASMYSMVGFQTKMKWGEQKRILQKIPALKNAEFYRYGSVHRNTYFQSPQILNHQLSLKKDPRIYLAGQITGVEGYTESAAIGLITALSACAFLKDQPFQIPPKSSMIGALCHYICYGTKGPFQPMNCNFGLLPLPTTSGPQKLPKKEKRKKQVLQARQAFHEWRANLHLS